MVCLDAVYIGTTVIREATNRRAILDQIFIQTGMRVEVIDMPKEVYFKYALVYYEMMYHHKATDEDTACLLQMLHLEGLV